MTWLLFGTLKEKLLLNFHCITLILRLLGSFQLWPFSELGSWTCSKRKYYVTSDSGSEDVTLKVCNLESCVSVLHKVTICLYVVRLRVFFCCFFYFFFAYWYRTLFLVVPNNKQAIFILDLMCNCKLWRISFFTRGALLCFLL